MFVYLITNTITGKYYVGKTTQKNLKSYIYNKKWKATSRTQKNTTPLMRSIKKHGADKFIYEVLAVGKSNEEICNLEKLWIILLNSRDLTIGYNLTDGGEGALGYVPPPELRKRWSEQRKGHPSWNKGKRGIHTEAGRRSMSLLRTGSGNGFFGKFHSEETKSKVSASNTRRVWTDKMRQKMSDTKKKEWAKRKALIDVASG